MYVLFRYRRSSRWYTSSMSCALNKSVCDGADSSTYQSVSAGGLETDVTHAQSYSGRVNCPTTASSSGTARRAVTRSECRSRR